MPDILAIIRVGQNEKLLLRKRAMGSAGRPRTQTSDMSLKIASRLIILISVALGVLFVANQKYSFVGNYGLNRELGALLSTRQRHAQDTLRGDGDSCLPPKTAIVFQDMHDGDKKTVREDGDQLVIEPYGNDEKWTVKAKLDKPNCR